MTVTQLARRNIKNKPQRTYALIALTVIVSIALYLSGFVVLSLKNGVVSLSNRMGADVIVVPEGYDSKITGAILRGEPNSFFLGEDVLPRIRRIGGVEYATPQLYVATLSAGCCSFPIQVIGIDTDSDFVVLPWAKNQVQLPIEKGGVLVGANIVGNVKEEVKFFNRNFRIQGRLGETGMGFDNSVFMPLDAARALAEEFKKLIGIENIDIQRSYSSIMVRVSPGVDPREVRDAIREEFKDEPGDRRVYALVSKQMMSEVASDMNVLLGYLYGQMILIWILTFGVLALVYSFAVKERKKEIATLRIIGATDRKIRTVLFSEAFIINAVGAGVGSFAGFLLSILFSKAISISFSMPFLSPPILFLILWMIAVFFVGALLGPMSAWMAIRKMTNTETQLLMREND